MQKIITNLKILWLISVDGAKLIVHSIEYTNMGCC